MTGRRPAFLHTAPRRSYWKRVGDLRPVFAFEQVQPWPPTPHGTNFRARFKRISGVAPQAYRRTFRGDAGHARPRQAPSGP